MAIDVSRPLGITWASNLLVQAGKGLEGLENCRRMLGENNDQMRNMRKHEKEAWGRGGMLRRFIYTGFVLVERHVYERGGYRQHVSMHHMRQ